VTTTQRRLRLIQSQCHWPSLLTFISPPASGLSLSDPDSVSLIPTSTSCSVDHACKGDNNNTPPRTARMEHMNNIDISNTDIDSTPPRAKPE